MNGSRLYVQKGEIFERMEAWNSCRKYPETVLSGGFLWSLRGV